MDNESDKAMTEEEIIDACEDMLPPPDRMAVRAICLKLWKKELANLFEILPNGTGQKKVYKVSVIPFKTDQGWTDYRIELERLE